MFLASLIFRFLHVLLFMYLVNWFEHSYFSHSLAVQNILYGLVFYRVNSRNAPVIRFLHLHEQLRKRATLLSFIYLFFFLVLIEPSSELKTPFNSTWKFRGSSSRFALSSFLQRIGQVICHLLFNRGSVGVSSCRLSVYWYNWIFDWRKISRFNKAGTRVTVRQRFLRARHLSLVRAPYVHVHVYYFAIFIHTDGTVEWKLGETHYDVGNEWLASNETFRRNFW